MTISDKHSIIRNRILDGMRKRIEDNRTQWNRESEVLLIHEAAWKELSEFVSEADINELGLALVFTPAHWPEDTATI
jgi:hypothetical protein